MNKSLIGTGLAATCFALLAACGSSPAGDGSSVAIGGTGTSPTPTPTPPASTIPTPVPTATCATPLAAQAITTGLSVTDKVPSDFDATATPTPTPTTTINMTILLPKRCAGDHFPLVLHSHGFGGSRLMAIAADGTLDDTAAHFDAITNLTMALPYYNYVVISYDERGHGTAAPGTATHNARIIDPAAETADARAILDWAFDNSDKYFIQTQPGSGIAKDLVVGTMGLSYGGGFEFPLEQLDPRVDTIVPNGTWNNLLYSLLPNDGLKLGFGSLLCLLASNTPSVGGNVNLTPLVGTLCNLIGPTGASAVTIRTRTDLSAAAEGATAMPRKARDEPEILNFFYTHSNRYFETQTRDGLAIDPRDVPGYMSPALLALTGFAGATFMPAPTIPAPARRTPVTALLLQGNRDSLFNLTEAYFNGEFLKKTVLKEGAADTSNIRILSTEGGHMNPLALQTQGTANCGARNSLTEIVAWLNHELKNQTSADYTNIPRLCISVTPTPANVTPPATAQTAPTNAQLTGLELSNGTWPIGDQGATTGGISVRAAKATNSVTQTGAALSNTSAAMPVFIPIGKAIGTCDATKPSGPANPCPLYAGSKTVAVLAGIPTAQLVSVTSQASAAVTPVAYIGIGIQRAGALILVDEQVTPFPALAPASGTTDCGATVAVPNSTYTATSSVTPLATDHCHNRGTGNYPASNAVPGVLFPAVGEPLQSGDQLGLLLYENQVQYLPANSGGVATGVPNPYTVTLYNVQIPVLIPNTGSNTASAYPASSLSGAAALP